MTRKHTAKCNIIVIIVLYRPVNNFIFACIKLIICSHYISLLIYFILKAPGSFLNVFTTLRSHYTNLYVQISLLRNKNIHVQNKKHLPHQPKYEQAILASVTW